MKWYNFNKKKLIWLNQPLLSDNRMEKFVHNGVNLDFIVTE